MVCSLSATLALLAAPRVLCGGLQRVADCKHLYCVSGPYVRRCGGDLQRVAALAARRAREDDGPRPRHRLLPLHSSRARRGRGGGGGGARRIVGTPRASLRSLSESAKLSESAPFLRVDAKPRRRSVMQGT